MFANGTLKSLKNLSVSISLLSNNQSFKQASDFIKKLFDINIAVDSIEKITQDTTTPFYDFFNTLVPVQAKEEEIVVVSADGKGVPMAKEESKNIKGRVEQGEKNRKRKSLL